jgi:rSAM/selenodomain-associated transferase 1
MLMAKAPVPGRSKTRLCPPCTPEDAARVAEAALRDTLTTLAASPYTITVALDGEPGPWLPEEMTVRPQLGPDLGARLAHAFDEHRTAGSGPVVVVGMDTPQLTTDDLHRAFASLRDGATAVLGPAHDGGYWLLGLREPDPVVFTGVEMSTPSTGAQQRRRLEQLGHRVTVLRTLRDVDTWSDAVEVAADLGDSHLRSCIDTLVAQYRHTGGGRSGRRGP